MGMGTGMSRTTPRVDGDTLTLAGNDEGRITVGTQAWFLWLEGANAFLFTGNRAGKLTARKEDRARGGHYWKAYHTVRGTLHGAYLGKTQDLTLDRLTDVAAKLSASALYP